MRVCPHTDRVCQHGVNCQFSCVMDEYDGTKRDMTLPTPVPAEGE